MSKHSSEEGADLSDRLRQIERLLAPRTPPDDETAPVRPNVERHVGRMYVAGHEPHFRPVTLLKPARSPREDGPDST